MNIDHHLQLAIIKKLVSSESSITYMNLKDKTIDNSLFSYHLNKLISRNMVVKGSDGYRLSVEGARWLNDHGVAMTPLESVRASVVLVIKDADNNYLIGQRTGQFKAQINDYLLPSKQYTNNADIDEQIEETRHLYIPENHLLEQGKFGFSQIKVTYSDSKTMWSLFDITVCKVKHFAPLESGDARQYEWKSTYEIDKFTHPSGVLIRKIIEHTNNKDNAHTTTIFSA